MSRVKHLQQRLYDLRERENLAKLHNRELLHQFDEAQKTLRELLERTTSMRMLRKEYESYIRSCSHLDYQLHHKSEKMFRERLLGKQNLKANDHLLHSKGCENMLRKNGVPPELKTQDQKPHQLPPRPVQEHLFADYPGPDFFLSHTSPPNEPYTDQLNPLTVQTDTMPKQPPGRLSESSGEDNCHSEDLDVKPVRLSVNQAGSQTSSQASSQGSTQKRTTSSSDEDWFSSHKSLQSRQVNTASKAMVFISETEDKESFSNQKSKHNGLGFKDTKNQEDTSVSESTAHKSNVDECSDTLPELSQEEPQRNIRLKKILIKEKEQSLSDHSSGQDEDDSDQTDGDRKETSQRGGEMSNPDTSRCSSVEGDHMSGSSPSSSDSSEESASSEWDDGEDNIKVCKSKQDNAHRLEDSDSEDFIISPQSRSQIIHVIPEHVVKHQDDNSKKTSSGDEDSDDSSDADDIEHVLAPPEQTQKQREPKADDKAKEPCNNLARLSVKDGQTDHHSDSNTSDDFYD